MAPVAQDKNERGDEEKSSSCVISARGASSNNIISDSCLPGQARARLGSLAEKMRSILEDIQWSSYFFTASNRNKIYFYIWKFLMNYSLSRI